MKQKGVQKGLFFMIPEYNYIVNTLQLPILG